MSMLIVTAKSGCPGTKTRSPINVSHAVGAKLLFIIVRPKSLHQ